MQIDGATVVKKMKMNEMKMKIKGMADKISHRIVPCLKNFNERESSKDRG